MANVFVSYRRRDARADAGRLHDRLAAHLGDEHVFMDVDDIQPGEDFNAVLETTLEQCSVLLVLIGADWLEKAADGRHGEARQLLQALVQHTGNLHEAWKPLATRLDPPGDGAGAPQIR